MWKSLLVGCGNATCENRRIGSLRVRRSILLNSRSYLASRPEPRKVMPLCALDRSNVKLILITVLRFGENLSAPIMCLGAVLSSVRKAQGKRLLPRGRDNGGEGPFTGTLLPGS